MIPAELTLYVVVGADLKQDFRFNTRNTDGTTGPAVDLTGYTVTAEILDGQTLIQTLTVTVTDAVNGAITVSASRTELNTLQSGNRWILWLENPALVKQAYLRGKVVVS